MSQPKICLVMIVKDEERVIERCLGALKPHITYWAIQDTGSTDSTVEKIKALMEGVQGKLFFEEFQSFQHNRTAIINLAKAEFPDADYLLMIDADDTFTVEEGFAWPEDLHLGGYHIKHRLGNTSFYRPALMKASLPWEYKGVAHEYATCNRRHSIGRFEGPTIVCGTDGARRVNEGNKKYERIAKILEEDLEKNPENKRSTFYLAQSYRDAGRKEDALRLYEKRATMGGWPQEVWHAKYQVGVMKERLGHPPEEVEAAYLEAYRYRPQRLEALHSMASHQRRRGDVGKAYLYARAGVTMDRTTDILFVEDAVYNWRIWDEYCVTSAKLGLLPESKDAATRLLKRTDLNTPIRRRIENNYTFACKPITPNRVRADGKVVIVLATKDPKPEALREAVQSILDQTYQNWQLVIVSDGNETLPWEHLDNLDDPRIVLRQIPKNVGQFAIYDAVIRETDAMMFAVQDDDDVSKPSRIEDLVKEMRRTMADVVFIDMEVESPKGNAYLWPSHPEWLAKDPSKLVHTGAHVGLWRVSSIRAIGGYYGGFKLGADTAIVGIMSRLGRPAFLRKALYKYRRTEESMTESPETKHGSAQRNRSWLRMSAMWDVIREAKNPLAQAHLMMKAGTETAVDMEMVCGHIRGISE